MTDEERQTLVDEIRRFAPDLRWMRQYQACLEAADELERLAGELRKAQAEAEKWRNNCNSMGWDVNAND